MAISPSPSQQRLAGVASITIAGRTYMLVGDGSYRPSTITRETLTGQDGVHGFKEMPTPGQIKATLRDAFGMSVGAFNAMVNAPVVLQLANGKTVVGSNMWTVETQEVNTQEATFEVTFQGNDVSEQ